MGTAYPPTEALAAYAIMPTGGMEGRLGARNLQFNLAMAGQQRPEQGNPAEDLEVLLSERESR